MKTILKSSEHESVERWLTHVPDLCLKQSTLGASVKPHGVLPDALGRADVILLAVATHDIQLGAFYYTATIRNPPNPKKKMLRSASHDGNLDDSFDFFLSILRLNFGAMWGFHLPIASRFSQGLVVIEAHSKWLVSVTRSHSARHPVSASRTSFRVMWVCRNVMFATLMFDEWNPTHKNGDEWGMVYSCYTHIS